jgi:hypothetical protein
MSRGFRRRDRPICGAGIAREEARGEIMEMEEPLVAPRHERVSVRL